MNLNAIGSITIHLIKLENREFNIIIHFLWLFFHSLLFGHKGCHTSHSFVIINLTNYVFNNNIIFNYLYMKSNPHPYNFYPHAFGRLTLHLYRIKNFNIHMNDPENTFTFHSLPTSKLEGACEQALWESVFVCIILKTMDSRSIFLALIYSRRNELNIKENISMMSMFNRILLLINIRISDQTERESTEIWITQK